MQSLGEFLRYTRKSQGITQEELANEMCVVSPVISKWENDKSIPDLAALCKLCNILEISLEECVALCKLDMPLTLPPANYDAQKLGERLKDLRIRNNLSQSDIGKELFVTSQTISRWESGEMNSLENLQSICQFYEISIGYLFQEETIQSSESCVLGNYCDESLSKSIEPQSEPTLRKKNFVKWAFVAALIIIIAVLSAICTKSIWLGKNDDILVFGEWYVSIEPTCIEEGEETRICYTTGEKETRIIPMIKHQPIYNSINYFTHSSICAVCLQEIDVEVAHTYENKICTYCGKTRISFIAPLDEYTLGQIYSEEHVFNPTLNLWHPHEGVDFAAPSGSLVKCIEDGTVKKVTNDSYSGATVTIEHSDGFTSVYKLIDGVSLKAGDNISKGDIIGKVSDTALEEIADGPHLHLELYKDGVGINPLDYIDDVKTTS
ncbi:MAG: peptidoglycan DD-metalloendopeptidase family protein [Clostridia bacterium]|nr:peptidoglycan DD-metalloendopeptidase family protein [Clostridia bacterium]